MARPPMGPRVVEGMEGTRGARLRLQMILETLSGARSVGEASRELGVNEARFYELRAEALSGALSRLELRRAGRPAKQVAKEEGEVEALRAQMRELRLELQGSRVREEIAIAMPHLLKRREEGGKKTKRR